MSDMPRLEPITMQVSRYWSKESGDCKPCTCCDDIIYGTRYNLALGIGGKVSETDINICESCHDAVVKGEL